MCWRRLKNKVTHTEPKGSPRHPASKEGPHFHVVNRSNIVSDIEVEKMAAACQKQARNEFADAWHGLGAETTIKAVGASELDPMKWWVIIADTIDAAGALGYHDTTDQGTPIIKIAAQTTTEGGHKVSTVLSHEIVETLADPAANVWAMDTATGTLYAYETADACQATEYAYTIGGVEVSDFLYPAFFDPSDPHGPYDHIGVIHEPLQTLPGGYQIIFKDGAVDYIYGDERPLPSLASRPHWREPRR